MSRGRRVLLAPGYLLHHTPYRDTSRILEVLARDHGRLTLFARGVRGANSKLAAVLQPFQPLLLSWSGRGEAAQLVGAELDGAPRRLPADRLLAGFYLNELILKLTTRHDPHPALYDAYHRALETLKGGGVSADSSVPARERVDVPRPDSLRGDVPRPNIERTDVERTLRLFERRLLEEVGYGLDLEADAETGRPIDPAAHYQFRPEQGLMPAAAGMRGALPGSSVLALAREQLAGEIELGDARRLLKAALDYCLEGRELTTRAVARAYHSLRPGRGRAATERRAGGQDERRWSRERTGRMPGPEARPGMDICESAPDRARSRDSAASGDPDRASHDPVPAIKKRLE